VATTASAETPRAQWRRALLSAHRGFGLGAALWLILLSLTGSAIAFYDELDRLLSPELRTVAISDAHGEVDVDGALRQIAASLPGFEPRFIDLPNHAGESLLLLGSVPRKDGEATPVHVFAHPQSGALLGWRELDTFSLTRQQLMNTLYALHTELMLGEIGAWFLGLLALLWVLDHVAAALLSLPRLAKWRAAFKIERRGSGLKRLFDLHRAPGMWLLPVTLMLAVSGLALSWYEESRAVVNLMSPVSERLHETFPDAKPAQRVGINATIAHVIQRTGARADSVVVLAHKNALAVRTFDERDIDIYGRLWTYVSMTDGRVLGTRHDNGEGAGDTFFAWQYPLHSGKAFGRSGQVVVCIAGLAITALCVTGVWLWWRRR
jgi:uncharacterized iron-regulated membrane protein